MASDRHSGVLVSELLIRRNPPIANRDRDSPVQQLLIDQLISRPSNEALSLPQQAKPRRTRRTS